MHKTNEHLHQHHDI